MKKLTLWLAAIALILTSCTIEDSADSSDHALRPMQFTVCMAGHTRGAVDDAWDGGEAVAVSVNNVVKKYKIVLGESEPVTLEPFDADVIPFYWPYSGETSVTVSAWYPYADEKQTVADIADQSDADKYEAANYMEAADVTKAYNADDHNFPLTFTHRMAKLIFVPYHMVDTEGQTTSQLDATEFAKTTATQVLQDITPYKNTTRQFEALLAPQTIDANTDLLTLTYTNSENDHTQTFKYTQVTAQTLLAGKTYTYSINFNTAADSSFVVSLSKEIYDGTEKTPTITVTCNSKTLTLDEDYEIDVDNSTLNATDLGTYTITVKGKGQYNPATTASATWTIKYAGTLTPPVAIENLTSNGYAQNLVTPGSYKEGETSVGTMYYWVTTDPESTPSIDDTGWSEAIPTATTAGTYYIWYKVTAIENYYDVGISGPIVVTIG